MKLIPFVSTHLRLLVEVDHCTVGKIYHIEEWLPVHYIIHYRIRDDRGVVREWYSYGDDIEVEDAAFEVNLQKILK